MKNSFKLHELQEKKKSEEDKSAIPKKPCTICSKMLSGAYGRWLQADESEVWTCSRVCENSYIERKQK